MLPGMGQFGGKTQPVLLVLGTQKTGQEGVALANQTSFNPPARPGSTIHKLRTPAVLQLIS